MEAVGATEEFLDELLISQFGDVGCPHCQQLVAPNSHRLVDGREFLFFGWRHFFLQLKDTIKSPTKIYRLYEVTEHWSRLAVLVNFTWKKIPVKPFTHLWTVGYKNFKSEAPHLLCFPSKQDELQMVPTVLETNERLISSHKMCWRWKGKETNPTSLTLLKGIFSISCCFSSCSRLWGFSGDPGRDWQKMSFTGEALNLPSKVRTCHCDTFKYSNQLSALRFWLCRCPGGAGASLDETGKAPEAVALLRAGKKGTELGIWIVNPVMSLGCIPRLPPPPFLFYQGDVRGEWWSCVFIFGVSSNPSRPSLWKEAAAPDFILIQQQNTFPVHFLCFFPTAAEA